MADYTGGPGADSIFGGGADESFDYSQGGNDTVWGGGGDDTIYLGAAFDGNDVVNGEAGVDTLELEGDYSAGVTVGPANVTNIESIVLMGFNTYRLNLLDGVVGPGETLSVNIADFVDAQVVNGSALVATALSVDLGGTSGQHVLGGALDDFVKLENGIDRSDVFNLGGGEDTLELNTVFLRAAGHNFRNVENIIFDAHASLTLNDGNVAAGQTLNLTTSAAGSTLVGVKERDGFLHMSGGTGTDGFYGGHLADTLDGGGGDDSIHGGQGADVLSGGAGADQFLYNSYLDSMRGAADLITDLDDSDTISLNGVDADITHKGFQYFQLVGAFDKHAGELTFGYDADTGYTRLAGDVDGDGKADLVILISGDHADFGGLVF